jgi:hypothetical protein
MAVGDGPVSANRQEKGGAACAQCGLKYGAHQLPSRHPRACSEWLTAAELQEDRRRDRDEAMHGWMLDPDMEAKA